jgi:flagellar hook-associated protein 3 FlgL
MVNFGPPLAGGGPIRVSSLLTRNVVLSNLNRAQRQLLRIQEQLSSGYRINRGSDDPVGASRVQDYTLGIRRDEQFLRNIEIAAGRLAVADGSLEGALSIVEEARGILLDQIGGLANTQTRQAAAGELTLLLQDALAQANRRFEGRSLFAGSRTKQDAFVLQDGGVVFLGDLQDLDTEISDGVRAASNLKGSVFGAYSDELIGRDSATLLPIDLDPGLSLDTRLADLHGGLGVLPGEIRLDLGAGAVTVNLATARTIGDVIDRINGSGVGITAAIDGTTGNSLVLTGAGVVTVSDLPGGRTASDLGIAGSAAASLPGSDLDPRITLDTGLGDLFAGSGLSSTSGIVIDNSTSTTTLTATIGAAVFTAPNATVRDLANAVSQAGVHVELSVSADGRRLELRSRISGGRLRVSENGGSTADELGFLSSLERSRLVDLGGGLGISTVDGDDLRITKTDGTQVLIDLDGLRTVRDFLDRVEQDPDLTATVNGLDQIVIGDASGGPNPLLIENVGGSGAATGLGIEGSAPGGTLTGSTLTWAGAQVEGFFGALLRLREGLLADDAAAIGASGRLLDLAEEDLAVGRGEIGVRTLQLDFTRDRLDRESTELELLRSSTRDVDLAEAATRFQIQQTVLEAALASAARILETNLLNYL